MYMNEPKLRFKADDGSQFPDWKEKKLGDISERILVGLATTVTPYYRKKGRPMFRNLNIKQGYLDDRDMLFLDDDYADSQKNKTIHFGDILTVHTGNIGWSCLVPEKYEGALSFTTLITTVKSNVVSNKYVCAFLNSSLGMNRMQNLAFSGGRANLNTSEFQKVQVPVPCLPEQQKIAEFLSTIDTVIAKQKETVSAWEERKKGVMQKLFSQEVRFKADDGSEFPDWEEKKLGDVADVKVGEKPTLVSDNAAYEYVNAGTTNSGYVDSYNCDGDTVTTPSRGQGGIGYVGYQKHEFWLGPLCYKIKSNKDDVLTKFMYYALSFDSKKIVDLKKVGTIPAINRADLIELYMNFPCLAEQQKIADCLSSLDEVIEKQKATLAAWEELKKGLLQQMFA